jgi:hypothetical protein
MFNTLFFQITHIPYYFLRYSLLYIIVEPISFRIYTIDGLYLLEFVYLCSQLGYTYIILYDFTDNLWFVDS